MKGCICGQPVARWGLYAVCRYPVVLPERPGLLIGDWQGERHARRQSTAAPLDAPPVLLVDECDVAASLLESTAGGS